MITRRRMLASGAGLAALAPAEGAAQERDGAGLADVPPQNRKSNMQITRSG